MSSPITNTNSPNNNPFDNFLGRLPDSVNQKIFSYLTVPDLKNLSLTSKQIRNETNNQYLWKFLLKRDFGKKIASSTPPELCKERYKDCCKKAQYIIKSIKPEACFKPNRLTFPQNFEELIKDLDPEDLGKALCKSLELNFSPLLEVIFLSSKIGDISLYLQYGLGHAYVVAAEYGQIGAMEQMEKLEGVAEIDANGLYGLACAYRMAAKRGQIGAMEQMEKLERFSEINVNEFWGLAHAYEVAAEHGQIGAMKQMEKLERFNEMSYDSLESAFVWAGLRFQIVAMTRVIKALWSTNRYKEMDYLTVLIIVSCFATILGYL